MESEDIFIQENLELWLTFNPGLALIDFQPTGAPRRKKHKKWNITRDSQILGSNQKFPQPTIFQMPIYTLQQFMF